MRRPDCLQYPACLADAAAADAADLPCHSCRRYLPTDHLWLYHLEINGLLRLWLVLLDKPEAGCIPDPGPGLVARPSILPRNGENGTGAENPVSSEIPALANEADKREFTKNRQLIKNGTDAENDKPSENPQLAENAEAVQVPRDTVQGWVSNFVENSTAEESTNWHNFDPPIYNVWMSCHTQGEIGEAVQVPQGTIKDWIPDFSGNLNSEESLKWHNFDPPIYNRRSRRSGSVSAGRRLSTWC